MEMEVPRPKSCDTFVCLPPLTSQNRVVFGKNSDRPSGEVQDIIYQARAGYDPSQKNVLKCTYIEIEQSAETLSVILSKPNWMWGAEMGANEAGVVIGNEAVYTKCNNSREDLVKRLLGMDLVRLGLERGKTAREALDVIVQLLEKYGQGGPCSKSDPRWSYHNSFLLADPTEAWVLETAGNKYWAAERVQSGYRNISNELSIGTRIDLASRNLQAEAFRLGYWDMNQPFHFARAFSDDFDESCKYGRFAEGKKLLAKHSAANQFGFRSMMAILRDKPSGICMGYDGGYQSTSSQVSVLSAEGSNVHWFTGTPDPELSLFKPFIFGKPAEEVNLIGHTRSANGQAHLLYKRHGQYFEAMSKYDPDFKDRFVADRRKLEEKWFEKAATTSPEGEDGKLFNYAVEDEYASFKPA